MRIIFLFAALFYCAQVLAHTADLLEVYHDALMNDSQFQQVVYQRLATKENVAIAFANFLPAMNISAAPIFCSNVAVCNELGFLPQNSYQISASITQTVFNFSQYQFYLKEKIVAKKADIDLNVAKQALFLRVAQQYFAILQDQEALDYVMKNKKNLAKQLEDVKTEYRIGLKTRTDVYTAQAAFDTAVANVIATNKKLNDDKENLRMTTNQNYSTLISLSSRALCGRRGSGRGGLKLHMQLEPSSPPPSPPAKSARGEGVFSIQSAQYAREIALKNIQQLKAAYFPVITLEGIFSVTWGHTSAQPRNINKAVLLNFSFPILADGISSVTKQAQYAYQIAAQNFEQTVRTVNRDAHQNYYDAIANLSKMDADQSLINSLKISLKEMQQEYLVGTVALIDVLNQQEKLLHAELQHSADYYAYLNNILNLQKNTGTLNPNNWNPLKMKDDFC